MISPSKISSLARADPMSRGNRWVPPEPGITPSRTSGMPRSAVLEATRRSQHRASSSPPPSALPSMAATVGTGRSASWLYTAFSSINFPSPTRPRSDVNSFTSEPAEKARSPEPANTTARTSSSPAMRRRASPSAAVTSFEMRLSGGLFNRMVTITPGSTTIRSSVTGLPR